MNSMKTPAFWLVFAADIAALAMLTHALMGVA